MKKEPSRRGSKSLGEENIAIAEPLQVEVEVIGDAVGAGYITDYISNIPVRATPEEIEAVQVFARRLVEDFGYPKKCITTRPQYRVRRRPSETKKSYPVDIAVFANARKSEDELLIVVECKSESVKDGRKQLELY